MTEDQELSTKPERGRDRDVGRLIGFTDGVVAIAITLIVLPLVDSARSIDAKPGQSGALVFLHANSLNLLAAALSFLVIASFWRDHNRLYRNALGSTPALVTANLLWLAGIIFLPLPTVLIVESPGHDPVAAGLYIGTVLVSQVAIRLQELILARAGLFSASAMPSRMTIRSDWVIVALTAVALILTVTIPTLWLYPLVLMWLARPIRWIAQRNAPKAIRARRIL